MIFVEIAEYKRVYIIKKTDYENRKQIENIQKT